MALAFDELINSSSYKELHPDDQQRVRAGYFQDVVAKDPDFQKFQPDQKVKIASEFLTPPGEVEDPKSTDVAYQFGNRIKKSAGRMATGLGSMLAKDELGDVEGMFTPEQVAKARADQAAERQATMQENNAPLVPAKPGSVASYAGAIGDMAPQIAGSMLIPGGPLVQGAVVGAANSIGSGKEGMDVVGDAAKDAAMFGLFHVGGKLGSGIASEGAGALTRKTGKELITKEFAKRAGSSAGGAVVGGVTGGTEGAVMGAGFGLANPSEPAKLPTGADIAAARNKGAQGLIFELIRPYKRDLAYGKEPDAVIPRRGITANSFEELAPAVEGHIEDVGSQIGSKVELATAEGKKVDASGVIDSIDKQIADQRDSRGAEAAGIIKRLQSLKDVILHSRHIVDENGNIVPDKTTARDLSDLTPSEAWEIKKMLGKQGKWTGNPSDDAALNGAVQGSFRVLKHAMNESVDGLAPLNKDYADLLSARQAIQNREIILKRNAKVGLYDRLGALLGYEVGPHNLVGAIGGTLINKALASTAVKTRIAKWLYSAPKAELSSAFSESPVLAEAVKREFPLDKKYAKDALVLDSMENALPAPKQPLGLPNLSAEGRYNGVREKPIITAASGEGEPVIPLGEKPSAIEQGGAEVKVSNAVEQGGESVPAKPTPEHYQTWLGNNKLSDNSVARQRYLKENWPDKVKAKIGLMGNKGAVNIEGKFNSDKVPMNISLNGDPESHWITKDGKLLDGAKDGNSHEGLAEGNKSALGLTKDKIHKASKFETKAAQAEYALDNSFPHAVAAIQNGNFRISTMPDALNIQLESLTPDNAAKLMNIIKNNNHYKLINVEDLNHNSLAEGNAAQVVAELNAKLKGGKISDVAKWHLAGEEGSIRTVGRQFLPGKSNVEDFKSSDKALFDAGWGDRDRAKKYFSPQTEAEKVAQQDYIKSEILRRQAPGKPVAWSISHDGNNRYISFFTKTIPGAIGEVANSPLGLMAGTSAALLAGSAVGNASQNVDIKKISQMESSGNVKAFNHKSGARGKNQITPITLKEWNNFHKNDQHKMLDLFDGKVNDKIADWYMNTRIPQMLKAKKLPDTTENRLIGYNRGVGNIGKPLPKETRDYLKKYKGAK